MLNNNNNNINDDNNIDNFNFDDIFENEDLDASDSEENVVQPLASWRNQLMSAFHYDKLIDYKNSPNVSVRNMKYVQIL